MTGWGHAEQGSGGISFLQGNERRENPRWQARGARAVRGEGSPCPLPPDQCRSTKGPAHLAQLQPAKICLSKRSPWGLCCSPPTKLPPRLPPGKGCLFSLLFPVVKPWGKKKSLQVKAFPLFPRILKIFFLCLEYSRAGESCSLFPFLKQFPGRPRSAAASTRSLRH